VIVKGGVAAGDDTSTQSDCRIPRLLARTEELLLALVASGNFCARLRGGPGVRAVRVATESNWLSERQTQRKSERPQYPLQYPQGEMLG
jgi:hypothetical protein